MGYYELLIHSAYQSNVLIANFEHLNIENLTLNISMPAGNPFILRYRHQISFLTLSEFKQINELLKSISS